MLRYYLSCFTSIKCTRAIQEATTLYFHTYIHATRGIVFRVNFEGNLRAVIRAREGSTPLLL